MNVEENNEEEVTSILLDLKYLTSPDYVQSEFPRSVPLLIFNFILRIIEYNIPGEELLRDIEIRKTLKLLSNQELHDVLVERVELYK